VCTYGAGPIITINININNKKIIKNRNNDNNIKNKNNNNIINKYGYPSVRIHTAPVLDCAQL